MRAPQVTPEGGEGPQSALERKIILEYLQSKGVNLENLSEVESCAKFRHDIHGPS